MHGIDKDKEIEIRKHLAGELSTREIDFVIKELRVFHLLNETDRKLTEKEVEFIDIFLKEEKEKEGK